MRCGCDAWLMLVQPTSHVVTMKADMRAGVEEGFVLKPEASCWNNLVAEFADVFEPPAMPAECKTMHMIELEVGAMPLFRRHYQVSAAELVEVRTQLDEYLKKDCIRPSCSPYGALIVFVWKKTGELCMAVDYNALN